MSDDHLRARGLFRYGGSKSKRITFNYKYNDEKDHELGVCRYPYMWRECAELV